MRDALPGLWLLATLWFRAEVRGLDRVPPAGRVLLVGNHSGGNVTPDTIIFTLAFSAFFGVERRIHPLVHQLMMALPLPIPLAKFGAVAASPANARMALEHEAAVLVYPGGDLEVARPSWQSAQVDFHGRMGFIRLALETDAPIVPVVSIGGQETALFLTDGQALARAARLDRLLRLKALPISLALPWGLNVGDFAGHLPLPAKIVIEALEPINLRSEFGSDPEPSAVYETVLARMQAKLDALAVERRFPIIG